MYRKRNERNKQVNGWKSTYFLLFYCVELEN